MSKSQKYIDDMTRQLSDYARRIQEQSDLLFGSATQIHKELHHLAEMQVNIHQFADPALKIQEDMRRLAESAYKMPEELRWLTEPLKMPKELHWLTEPLKIKEELFRLAEPASLVKDHLGLLAGNSRTIIEELDRITAADSYFMKNYLHIDRLLNSQMNINHLVSETLRTVDLKNIQISNDGSATIDGVLVTVPEFKESFDSFLCILPHNPTLTQFLERIWKHLNKLKKPTRLLFIFIIMPFLINLSTPHVQLWIDSFSTKSKKGQIKVIKNEYIESYGLTLLKNYRFVSVKFLSIREHDSGKSKILDEISFGQVVKIIIKRRNWSYIEFIDEDNNKQFGWVYSRYLLKFKK